MAKITGLRCFGGEPVPMAMRDDLSPLNAFSSSDLDSLATLTLEHLTKLETAALISAVSAFAKSRNIKNMAVLESGVRGLIAVLQACAKNQASSSDLEADVVTLGLDVSHASALARSWTTFFSRKQAAAEELPVAAQLDPEDLRQLVDLEWKFGVTCANSDSDKPVGKTFLQLKLVLCRKKDGAYENLYLELTLPQFYDFLAQMEKAKAAMKHIAKATASSS